MFSIQNDLKEKDRPALTPLLFNFSLEYVIMEIQDSEEMELNKGKNNSLLEGIDSKGF
jgi:hypothetical protein